ncbi:hypothetical protein W97_06455 [Coniosporium apollinis CBS 100218]|uniref:Vacuolar protein sorting-associated protein 28 n=1 Tax=Coniosporium apollinis (strain CBS 100218) TaxID=1168221 RepID=R7YZ73_CONA1|nr:uncharacterized protein W97_06455 [Coniosporium apollinis CBS 100218]EON67202.1 hypothetical protein W97_06455 [Coniosporium apollinis CBS 100218]
MTSAYAPAPYGWAVPTSRLSANINLDEEVTFSSLEAETEMHETLADIYGILVTLDKIERAFLKDSISESAYADTCSRLMKQYKAYLSDEATKRAFGDLESFKRDFDVNVPLATARLRIGIPATVQGSRQQASGQATGKAAPELVMSATENFITLLDAIKIGLLEKDTLHPLLVEVIQAVNQVTDVDFEGKGKIVQWLIVLNQMGVADKLDENRARELRFDIEQVYRAFKGLLAREAGQETSKD